MDGLTAEPALEDDKLANGHDDGDSADEHGVPEDALVGAFGGLAVGLLTPAVGVLKFGDLTQVGVDALQCLLDRTQIVLGNEILLSEVLLRLARKSGPLSVGAGALNLKLNPLRGVAAHSVVKADLVCALNSRAEGLTIDVLALKVHLLSDHSVGRIVNLSQKKKKSQRKTILSKLCSVCEQTL